jgi:hypothetical protein
VGEGAALLVGHGWACYQAHAIVGWERPDKGWERKKRKEKKEKRKRKRKRKRVLWGFYPFYLLGEAVLPNGKKTALAFQVNLIHR